MSGLIDARRSTLLLIDLQAKLMPVIDGGPRVMDNARRILSAARLFCVPVVVTEQYRRALGATVPELDVRDAEVVRKTTFDATRAEGLLERLPADRDVLALGCEAHVCVLQTVLGLVDAGRKVWVVSDAIGSRSTHNRDAALVRLGEAGVVSVTAEMVMFEWLGDAADARFRDVMRLVR